MTEREFMEGAHDESLRGQPQLNVPQDDGTTPAAVDAAGQRCADRRPCCTRCATATGWTCWPGPRSPTAPAGGPIADANPPADALALEERGHDHGVPDA